MAVDVCRTRFAIHGEFANAEAQFVTDQET